MSFTSDYLDQEKKKKKQSTGDSFTDAFLEYEAKQIAEFEAEEQKAKAVKEAWEQQRAAQQETVDDRKWFEAGAFEDGYQFGDIAKTLLGSATDLTANVTGGALEIGEKVVDAGAYLVGGAAKLFGGDKFADDVQGFIEKDLYDGEKIAANTTGHATKAILGLLGEDDYDEVSVFGEKIDSLAQSGGQLAGTIALQAVGVPWFVTSGVTSFGSATEEAFKEDASYGEAGLYGAITAGAEILTEKLFGGSGLGEKGLINLDGLTKGISSKVVKALADVGVDMAAEGSEEVVSSVVGRLASSLYKEERLGDLLLSEEAVDEYIESFIGGAVLGGVANTGKAASSIKTGRDYRTGLVGNEQAVFDAEYNKRVAEEEKDGKKLTKKEKAEIYDEVMNDLEKGYISTDSIEEVLGGADYKSYQDTVKNEDTLLKELNELRNMKSGDMTDIQKDRLTELKGMNLTDTTKRDGLKTKLTESVYGLVKDTKLAESYNERARRGQTFEADLSGYDTKQAKIVKKAIDSGILNNTRRTHEFVDMVAKISADKGVLFDFANNAKLKESGFAVDGATINGYVTKDGITVNIDSAKSLNSVVGHEIAHVLEGTELYTEMQSALFEYAKTKGDYKGRFDTLSKLYKDVEGADVDAELTADLVGDYLFTDSDFINNLSTKHRNVFQKIYDEIKYLCKVATAGSKEARELEKVKRAFDKAYKESGKTEGTKYSLSNSETDKNYLDAVERGDTDTVQRMVDEAASEAGYKKLFYHGTASGDFTKFKSNGKPMWITENKEYAEVYANAKDGTGYAEDRKVMPLYAKMDKILDLTSIDTGKLLSEEFYRTPSRSDLDSPSEELHKLADLLGEDALTLADMCRGTTYESIWQLVNSKKFANMAREKGYDAIKENEFGNITYGVLDNTQLKSADAVTYKKNKVIPLSKRFNTENEDIRYSLSNPQTDKDYLDAVNRGDTETAQKMVDEAAKDAGYTIKSYHGTLAKDFTEFKKSFIGSRFNYDDKGFFFIDRKSIAEDYATSEYDRNMKGRVLEVYLRVKKPLLVDKAFCLREGLGNPFRDDDAIGVWDAYLEFFKDEAAARKADGIILDDGMSKMTVVFDGEQIKSADPVTYDSDGNVIPLSQRFNAENNDIRYSLSDSDGKALTKEQSEYFKDSKMRDDNGNLKVMYHGSQDAGFHVFDPSMSDDGISLFFVDRNDVATSYSGTSETYAPRVFKSAEDANNFLKEMGFYGGKYGYEVVENDGEFTLFAGDEAIATSDNMAEIYEEFCDYEGVGYGDANYKVYLNLTNPLVVDAKGRPWNKIDAEFSQEIYDKYKSLTAEEKAALADLAEWEDFRIFNSEIQEARGDALASAYAKMGEDCNIYDLFSVAADNFSEEAMRENARGYLKTRDYAQRAKEGGYDGVILKNVIDNGGYSNGSEGASTVAIAFNPEQVKSVANEKPTANKDIRYSLSAETDKAYLDAVKRGDMETAQMMVNQAAKDAGYTDDSSWKMQHSAPNSNYDVSLYDLKKSGLVPDDYWDHPEWYTYGAEERESFYKIKDALSKQERWDAEGKTKYNGKPAEARIWVYRAVDKTVNSKEDHFRNGDWVTPSYNYAVNEGQMNPKGYRIIKHNVSIKDLYWDGNSIAELGYDDGKTYAYKDTVNNRKLLDPVTYDDYGLVIPLSKRFKYRNSDTRYSLSAEGSTPKSYGNYNVSGKDIALDIAPVQDSVQDSVQVDEAVAPVDEAVDEVVDKAPSLSEIYGEEYAPVENAYTVEQEMKALQDEMVAVYEEYNALKNEGKDAEAQPLFDKFLELNERGQELYEKAEAYKAEEQSAADSLTDADAPPEVEAPYSENNIIDPFEERDIKAVGNPKVNAYMYENPEVKPYFQAEAERLLGEYQRGSKAQSFYNGDLKQDISYEFAQDIPEIYRVGRDMSPSIEYLRDTVGLSYGDIEKGLAAIIEDNGAENIAAAKRIEFELHNRLMDGYTDDSGANAPANQEYRDLIKEMGVNPYIEEAKNALFASLDLRTEKPDDIAPVAPTFDTARKDQIPGQQSLYEDAPTETAEAETAEAEEPKIAKVLESTPKEQKKGKLATKVRNLVFDKQSVIEDISLKTKNRELMGKADFMLRSESRAQRHIKNKLMPILERVERTGNRQAFEEYAYHLHNIDRMSLEGKAQARIAELEGKFKDLKPEQVKAIAAKEITDKTTERTANTIREAKEYLNALETKNKPVFGDEITADVSREIVKNFEAEHKDAREISEAITEYNNELRQMLVDGGIISQETADLWANMYPHYVPIRRAGKDGAAVKVPLDSMRTGVNAPIARATGGNSDIESLLDVMGSRTEQVYRAVARNNFGVELMHTLDTVTDTQPASIDEVLDSFGNESDELLKAGENGANPTFTVFEDGQRITFDITEELYDALKPTNDLLKADIPGMSFLTKLQRGILTQYNPTFIATNAVKDIQDVLVNSQHATRTYANVPLAVAELIKGKGKWITEYMDNGGEDLTYFDSKKQVFKKKDSAVKKVLGFVPDKIAKANDFVEKIPRLAEYIASRKNGASIEVSMLDAARVTTNFAAGGDLTKFANKNGFTFLNASVQGFNQQVRNVREAKANGLKGVMQLAAKVAIAGLPVMLLNHLLWDDDEEYEELSDYVKDNYYIVAKKEDGTFVRIPKGRAVAVIQNAFEQMDNYISGDDEVDMKRFGELVVNNLAPNNPLENNVIAPIGDVIDNKTWYGEDLVPSRLQDLPEAEQFDETTDSISKWLGEVTNTSPYKWNYVIDQYSGGLGDVVLPYLTPESDGGGVLAPFIDKFTTDSVKKNQNVSTFYETVDELTKNANSMHATDEDILKSKYINSISTELGKLYQQKREVQSSDDYTDTEKDELVRDIQKQINDMAEESLNTYGNVNIDGVYATVGDLHYRWYEPGEDSTAEAGWQKLTDKQIEKQNEVTSGLGISAGEYWSNKEEYDFAYESPGKYAVSKAVGGYKAFKTYSSELYDIKADKDEDGKSISGSRKEKVIDYVNNLDVDYGTRLILFKSEYNADDTYNYDIIDYLNNREDISYEDMAAILVEIGFTVDSKGNITWD